MNIDIKKPIFDCILQTVKDIPGWCPDDELFALYMLALSTLYVEGEFLEIGAFCGKSTTALAMAAEKINTKLYSIDLFPTKSDWFKEEDNTYNFKVNINDRTYTLGEYRFWEEPFFNTVLPVYQKHGDNLEAYVYNNLKNNKLENIVTLIKGTSREFAEQYDKKIKLVFIDGDHSYEGAKTDINNIEKFLVPGAIVIFDDAFANYQGNDRAIMEFIVNSGKYECFQQLTRKCFVARKK